MGQRVGQPADYITVGERARSAHADPAGDRVSEPGGDLPDRGPDTLKIIEHVRGLAKQAKRKGGRVHSLIGNHEANASGACCSMCCMYTSK